MKRSAARSAENQFRGLMRQFLRLLLLISALFAMSVSTVSTAQAGTIVIVKTTVGLDGTFDFNATAGIGNFSLTTVANTATSTYAGLAANTYTVAEIQTSGFSISAVVCVTAGLGSTVSIGAASATITLTDFDIVTCTFASIGDSTAPTAASFSRHTPATSPTNADVLVFRAMFSEDVQNVDTSDFDVDGTTTATVTNVAVVSQSVYDVTISGGDLAGFNGTVGLNLRAGQDITDLSLNPLPTVEPAVDESYLVDNSGATAASFTRHIPATSPTNADVLVFRAVFSEPVQNVDTSDFDVDGTTTATVTNVAVVSQSVYDVTVSGGDLAGFNGTVGLNLRAGQDITDLSLNPLPTAEPAVDESYLLDNSGATAASFSRHTPATSPTNADVLVFRAMFSEDVQNVDTSDFDVDGTTTATVTNVAAVSQSVYDVTVSGGDLAGFNGTVGLNLRAGQDITDLSLNPLPTVEPAVDESYLLDNSGATAASFSRHTPATSPTNADVLVFRAMFSEDVQNVDTSDFDVDGTTTATVTNVAVVSQSVYDVTVSGGDLAGFNGSVGLNLRAGQDITDLSLNPLPTVEPAVDESYLLDNSGATAASFSRHTPATSPTNADVLVFRAMFSEDVQNVDTSDFDIDGTTTATVTNVAVVSQSVYDVTISGGDLAGFNGTVGLNLRAGQDITDLSLNPLPTVEPAVDESYLVDNTAVSVGSFARHNPATSPTNADVLVFRATFNKAVQNVDTTDFEVDGTTTATVTNVGAMSPSVYDVTVSGGDLASFNGTVGLNLRAGQDITDLSLNPLPTAEPANDEIYLLDNSLTVAIQNAPPSVNSTNPIVVTFEFSDPAIGFDISDVVVTNATTGGFVAIDGDTYTVTITPDGAGDVTITVPANAATNAAGDGNQLATTTILFDTLQPSVTISGVTNATGPVVVTYTFSEDVIGFDIGDITITNATLSNFVAVNGATYTTLVTPTTQGPVRIDVAAGVAQDVSGNLNTAATTFVISYLEESYVRRRTQRIIANYMNRRADQITAAEPDLVERLRRRGQSGGSSGPMGFEGAGNSSASRFAFSTSLRRMAESAANAKRQKQEQLVPELALNAMRSKVSSVATHSDFDVWIEGKFSQTNNETRDTHLGILHVGTDYQVSSNLLVGVLAQFDWTKEVDDTENTSVGGFGWLAGPYVVARLHSNLFFDARAAWGQSYDHVNPLGTYTDAFETNRWLLRSRFTGDLNYGALRLAPHVGLIYFEEMQKSYVDSNNIVIPGQTISLGRVTFGPKVTYTQQTSYNSMMSAHFGITGIWDYDKADIVDVDTGIVANKDDAFRTRIDSGVSTQFANGWSVRGEAFYDGIGATDLQSYGGTVSMNVPLN